MILFMPMENPGDRLAMSARRGARALFHRARAGGSGILDTKYGILYPREVYPPRNVPRARSAVLI